ncbi:MAG: T9SS type A sorting domain-containing protein [Bacteroidota bacterium]
MKSEISILLLLISFFSYSQIPDYCDYMIDFEDTNQFFRLEIDSVSNPNNIWQIGVPNKQNFNSSLSHTHAIITDSINSYPVNDTSFFIVRHIASYCQGFYYTYIAGIKGYFKVNSDSLNDYGTIEFSPSNGYEWIDIINDQEYSYFDWYNKPVLTGNSYGWEYFSVNIAEIFGEFWIFPGDTVLYKFSFISDGIQTNKDGLMYDDLRFEDWAEAIEDIDSNKTMSFIFPNPANSEINIEIADNEENTLFEMYNSKGQIVYKSIICDNYSKIDVRGFLPGLYLMKLSNSMFYQKRKLIIN